MLVDLTLIPFLVGLFSAVHCLGMCGGIVGMLTAGLPREVREHTLRRSLYLLLYNFARIASYAAGGALTGTLGAQALQGISPEFGHRMLQWLAGILLLGIGLYLAGWFPQLARLERLGLPLWRRLEPLAQRVLPVDSPLKALTFGALWGWFPCGLVYTTVFYATASGGAWQGALFMTFFGLGTLPATFGAGMISGWLARATHNTSLRRLVGLIVITTAVATLILPALMPTVPSLPTAIPWQRQEVEP